MTLRLGTRQLQGFRNEHPSDRLYDRGLTPDAGMSKRVVSNATFTNSDNRITGANGDFSAFGVGDPILIEGTNLNNGERIVTGIDATNHAYLVLDAGPKNEGPISTTVRTP